MPIQDERVAALRELHRLLRAGDAAAADAVAPNLARLWPQTLALLAHADAGIRQSAAALLGVLGALAAKPGAKGAHELPSVTQHFTPML